MWFLLWLIGFVGVCGLISIYLWISFCYRFLILFHCDERTYFVLSLLIYLKVLRHVLWPNTWTVFENISYTFKKKVNVLQVCVNSNWFIVLFKPYVSLLIFYLFFYPLSKIEYIRFSNYCLIVSFSLCSVSFCFMYFGALLLGMCCWAKLLQLYLTLCDPMDCSLPGSSVHGILQARILAWVAMPAFRESSRLRDWTCISYVSCIGRQNLYH